MNASEICRCKKASIPLTSPESSKTIGHVNNFLPLKNKTVDKNNVRTTAFPRTNDSYRGRWLTKEWKLDVDVWQSPDYLSFFDFEAWLVLFQTQELMNLKLGEQHKSSMSETFSIMSDFCLSSAGLFFSFLPKRHRGSDHRGYALNEMCSRLFQVIHLSNDPGKRIMSHRGAKVNAKRVFVSCMFITNLKGTR